MIHPPAVRPRLHHGLAVVLLLLAGAALAQPVAPPTPYRWNVLPVGAGGFITGVDLPPDGSTRYIRTDTYGAWRWEGDRWVQLVNARSMPAAELAQGAFDTGVQEIASAPSNPNRVYMALRGAVYRSDNRGNTWARTAFSPVPMNANDPWRTEGNKMAVDPANPDVVFLGTPQDGLWRTLDGGANWTRQTAVPAGQDELIEGTVRGPGIVGIHFEPGAPVVGGRTQVLVVGSWRNGIYRSIDGGADFARIATGDDASPRGIVRAAFGPQATLYVVDGRGAWRRRGGTWTRIRTDGNLVAVAADPGNDDRVYVFTDGGRAFRSTSGGSTWSSQIAPALEVAGDIPWHGFTEENFFTTAQVSFDPQVAGRLWIGQGIGVWRAQVADGQSTITWQGESRGIEQLVGNDVLSAPGRAPVLAAWDRALFRAANLAQFPATHGPTNRFNSAWMLDSTPALPGFVVANVSDHRFCCEGDGLSSQAGYSLDGGITWTPFAVQPGPGAGAFGFGNIAVAANSADKIVWAPTFDRTPRYTTNRGGNWQPVNLPGFGGSPSGSHFGLFLNRKILAADRVLPDTFYLAHSGLQGQGEAVVIATRGLYRSTDGGANWQRVFSEELAPFSIFNATLKAVPGRAGHLFFTSGPLDGFDGPFRRSLDRGDSWGSVPGVTRVVAFGFGRPAAPGAYPTIYIAGKVGGTYGLWRSIDDATTWSRIGTWPTDSLDTVRAIDGDKDVFSRVYLALSGSGFAWGEIDADPLFGNGFESP